jgi:hypothetical protein
VDDDEFTEFKNGDDDIKEDEEESKTAPAHTKSTPEVKSLPVID